MENKKRNKTLALFLASLALASVPLTALAVSYSSAMTCEEFSSSDDGSWTKAVYWTNDLKRNGRPEDAAIGVERDDRLPPFVFEECGSSPSVSLVRKIKAEIKKMKI